MLDRPDDVRHPAQPECSTSSSSAGQRTSPTRSSAATSTSAKTACWWPAAWLATRATRCPTPGRCTWPPTTPRRPWKWRSAHGGRVLIEPMHVGELGTMAAVIDPGGAVIGVWKPGLHKGFGVLGEPGRRAGSSCTPATTTASVAFYRDVFGWDAQTMSDTPEFRYTVLQHGETQLAGIMDASVFPSDGVPAHWAVYFGVDRHRRSGRHRFGAGWSGRPGRRGHSLRPAGRRHRPDGRAVPAHDRRRGHRRSGLNSRCFGIRPAPNGSDRWLFDTYT